MLNNILKFELNRTKRNILTNTTAPQPSGTLPRARRSRTSRRLGLKWKSEILPGVWSETESVARPLVVDHAPVRACHWTEHGRAWSKHPRIARAQVDGNLHPQKVALFELVAN